MFSFREFLGALQAYGKAHQFIIKHKLWKWIIIPGVIYCLLFILGIIFVWSYSGDFVEFLFNLLPLKMWMAELENSWVNFIFLLLGFSVRIILLLLYFSFFKYLFLIVGSPVFAYLSEKTEAIIQHKDFPFSWKQLLEDIARGIRLSFRNLLYQSMYMAAIFLLAFIPVVGWITPLVALIIECYYFGFSMMDYSFERRRWSMRQSIVYIGQHRGMAIGNGLVFYIMMFVPIIGWIVAPCYAVIAATIHLQQQRLP
ncbi:EI24 domain-containing protein [Chitinophaga horti]|uniref:EI24 domain-containing protein n=1 Tax=Chitinophaga horti TaxID=2920382 RepID=A0ABY6IY25_9BACT|nr:EI24 domain-containing protein [Chitinophaga horti]UYQ92280.1 EI24 domain-containing protein [Chitinophaga horti]